MCLYAHACIVKVKSSQNKKIENDYINAVYLLFTVYTDCLLTCLQILFIIDFFLDCLIVFSCENLAVLQLSTNLGLFGVCLS